MPPEAKDLKVVRDLFAGIQTQLCSSVELLSSPLKEMFVGIKNQLDEKLSKLPPTEQVPASLDLGYQLNQLHWCLQGVDQMIQILNQSLKGTSAQMASLVAAEIDKQIADGLLIKKEEIPVVVSAAIETKVKDGELVPKDTVTQLCSQAKTNGITEGETNLKNQLAAQEAAARKIGERKTTLQTAGVPILDADVATILAGTDDEFNARQTRYQTRLTDLKGQGYQLNSPELLAPLWHEDADYNKFVKTIAGIPALKVAGEPFAGGGASGNGGDGKTIPVNFLV